MKNKIAAGILIWEGGERRTRRYGSIHLCNSPFDGPSHGDAKCIYDIDALNASTNKRVRLSAKVVNTRTSGHAGDYYLKIYPSTPNVGDEIVLGVGLLYVDKGWDGNPDIVLKPDDGRNEFWIDPRILYRLHDQTVEIYAEETTEDFTPAPDIPVENNESAAFDNGDGSFQVSGVKNSENVKILPRAERIGPGMFSLNFQLGKGERLDIRK